MPHLPGARVCLHQPQLCVQGLLWGRALDRGSGVALKTKNFTSLHLRLSGTVSSCCLIRRVWGQWSLEELFSTLEEYERDWYIGLVAGRTVSYRRNPSSSHWAMTSPWALTQGWFGYAV